MHKYHALYAARFRAQGRTSFDSRDYRHEILQTNEEGRLERRFLPEGDYVVEASLKGYRPERRRVSVRMDATRTASRSRSRRRSKRAGLPRYGNGLARSPALAGSSGGVRRTSTANRQGRFTDDLQREMIHVARATIHASRNTIHASRFTWTCPSCDLAHRSRSRSNSSRDRVVSAGA